VNKRYIVKVVDTEGTVWLNTGSFCLTEDERTQFLESLEGEVNWWIQWEPETVAQEEKRDH
jgi:hypothetical protein